LQIPHAALLLVTAIPENRRRLLRNIMTRHILAALEARIWLSPEILWEICGFFMRP
jgi:hypothetical protein